MTSEEEKKALRSGAFAKHLMRGIMRNYSRYFHIEENVYHAENLFRANAVFRWIERAFMKNILNEPEDIERYIDAAYEYLDGNVDIEWYYGNPLIWEKEDIIY
jgi:hypothetical protein